VNMTALTRTIHARITGDIGPGGLFNTTDGLLYDAERAGPSRFRRNYADDIETTITEGWPVVVWRIASIAPGSGTMVSDEHVARIEFEIYGRPPKRPGDTGDIDVSTIADRIYGDASGQVSFVPTFGLYRFMPDDTAWNGYVAAGPFMHTGTENEYTDKAIVVRSTFEIRYGRTRPAI